MKNHKLITIIILVTLLLVTGLISIKTNLVSNIFKLKANVLQSDDIYDVILFWGQSNMVGATGCEERLSTDTKKGEDVIDQRLVNLGANAFSQKSGIDLEIVNNYDKMSHVNVNISSNTVFDYKYLSNSITPLSNNSSPVGENLYIQLNNGKVSFVSIVGESFATNRACGTNMTEYFSKTYYEKTGHKVIIVHVANGGEEIAHFLPHNRVLEESQVLNSNLKNQYIYEAMIEKYNSAINYLNSHSMSIGRKFYVVFQGENDANYANTGRMTSQKYQNLFMEVHNNLKQELGLQFGVIVETSRTIGTCATTGVEIIHDAQESLINNNSDIFFGSSYSYDTFIPCESEYTGSLDYDTAKSNAHLGVSISEVSNNTIHFNSAALSQIGKDSALNVVNDTMLTITFHKNTDPDSTAKQTFSYGIKNQKFGYNADGTAIWGITGQFGKWDRSGYTLLGWSKNPNATTPSYNKVYYDVTDKFITDNSPSIDLYAIWAPKQYDIVFDANGGTHDDSTTFTEKATYDQVFTIKESWGSWFTKRGYQFSGWYENENGTGTNYDKWSKNWVWDYGWKLYAKWTPNTNTITFNKNDEAATGTMSDIIKTYGVPITAPKNQFKKEGYKLKYWNLYIDGTHQTKIYDEGTIGDLTAIGGTTLVLYAQWEPITYTIKFDANGGVGTMSDITKTYGVPITAPKNVFTKEGYKFKNWNLYMDGSHVTNISDEGTIGNLTTIEGKEMTLYAQWEPITYTIKFDANGGVGTMSDITKTYGVPITAPKNVFTKEGYKFKNWNLYMDGSHVTNISDEGTIGNLTTIEGKEMTLYAQWEPITYTIKFDANGGVGTMSDITKTYGVPITAPKNVFTKEGYKFKNWNLYMDGSHVTNISDEGTIGNLTTIEGKEMTLYAQWEPITYTIKFDANGGVGTMSDITKTYGVPITAPKNVFTKEGYKFKNWNLYMDGSHVTNISDEGTIGNLTTIEGKEMTLYAQWEPITYTIKFDANGGVGTMSDITKTYGVPITAPKNVFTKEGYKFKNWNLYMDGSHVTSIDDEGTIGNLTTIAGKEMTLYAIWEEIGQEEKIIDLTNLDVREDKIMFNEIKTLNELKQTLQTEEIILKDKEGNVKSNTSKLGTGNTLTIGDTTYTLSVKGDLSGDGKTEFEDVFSSYYYFKNSNQLNDIYRYAADFNGDNLVEFEDVFSMYHLFKNSTNLN